MGQCSDKIPVIANVSSFYYLLVEYRRSRANAAYVLKVHIMEIHWDQTMDYNDKDAVLRGLR